MRHKTSMSYYEYSINVSPPFRDALIKNLYDAGSLGIIEEDDRIRAYFPAGSDMRKIEQDLAVSQALMEASSQHGAFAFQRTLIPDRDWNETWKQGFHAIDVGDRFTILPPWEQKKTGRINLVIDPAMAFGTGHHETTRSCLLLIEKYADRTGKEHFLDIGTGTGILAIAAAKLGFHHVTGIDTDILAVEAARENIVINSTPDICIQMGSLTISNGEFDVIVANIISGVLVMLAPAIASHLRLKGFCILSGILHGQDDEVVEAMRKAGLGLVERWPDGKWISLVVTR